MASFDIFSVLQADIRSFIILKRVEWNPAQTGPIQP
jgi:hypothetical protein